MPELPDLRVYLEHLHALTAGEVLRAARVRSPFLLRTFEPPLASAVGRRVLGYQLLGKRVVWELEGDLYLVVHLMVAGRLQWQKQAPALEGRHTLASFDFPVGSVMLTEASTRQRASLHVVQGAKELAALDPGGLDPLRCSTSEFAQRIRQENRTLKRALTLPHLLSGIGNAYSDEILHAAKLSPVRLTTSLADDEVESLHKACVGTLSLWIERLRQQSADAWPKKVTAFHPSMAVHGRYGKPCPSCGTAIQRIRRASNEANYCPRCQTAGKLLADRSLSRLLGADWPATIEEWELGPLAKGKPAVKGKPARSRPRRG